MSGKIDFFNQKRGFGVIKIKNGNELFFHISDVISRAITQNQIVTFKIRVNLKKKRKEAYDIRIKGEVKPPVKIKRPPKKRNTETFEPNHKRMDMRIVSVVAGERYQQPCYNNDVIIVHNLFDRSLGLYDKLYKEVNDNETFLFKLWHGNTHYIVDDKLKWKDSCPTFNMVLERIKTYFNIKIKATRFNYYKDTSQWKPYHHDAAALKEDKAKEQNITIAVSFGATRDVAFEHAKRRTKTSIQIGDCQAYVFNKDVNIEWRHGILQEKNTRDEGRISIIVWGKKTDMCDYP